MEYVSLIHYFIICPAVFCALCSLCGSFMGSNLALLVPENIFKIVMIVLLPFIAFYVLKNKNFETDKKTFSPRKTLIICLVCALLVGFYDGFYGPGTGTFLLILLTVLFIKIIYELIVARVGL